MSLWFWLLCAAATAYLLKLAGYLLPQSWLDAEWVTDLAGALTVGLLASLTILNTVGAGQGLAADSRLVAFLAAGIALWLRAPYLLVVVIGAVAAGLSRLAGLP